MVLGKLKTKRIDPMNEISTAIVTGAGSGVGRATALGLAQVGWRVALVGRTESKLLDTAKACKGAVVITADLTDPAACRQVVADALEGLGQLDAVAHIAGDAPNMPIAQLTGDVVQRCLATNIAATANLTAAAWPTFAAQGRGMFVNVSSMASLDPFPGFSIYAAAKVAVNLFTRCTAQEGAANGIQAVCVAPGAVETPMLRAVFDESMIPKDKALDPRDVARVITDCITGARRFQPGETIVVPSG
jgi:NAD(P)-dependent dehydrogenase (short-subunit alcohol dehydrogenase family)